MRATRLACGLALAARPGLAQRAGSETATAVLSGFEHAPTEAQVREMGAARLMAVADDPRAPLVARVRAVHALRLFATDSAVRAYLRAVASAPARGVHARRAAFEALLSGAGDVAEVARHLADPERTVRDAAAWSLWRSPLPAARDALARARATEHDPLVLRTLREAPRAPR